MEEKVEVHTREDRPRCMTANGFLICYCGKCEPQDYKLPKDFHIIKNIMKELPQDWKKEYRKIAKPPEGYYIDPKLQKLLDRIEDFIRELLVKENREIVICAAVKSKDVKIIRGHRHGNCMEAMRMMGLEYSSEAASQGFMTSRNRFVDRTEGLELQKAAGIPSADKDGYRYMLFSEDLY